MYRGDSQKANLYTLMLTVNGASLSKDLALRSVEIRLKRPVYRAGWLEEVRAFMSVHKAQIIGDAIWMLQSQGVELPQEGTTRWNRKKRFFQVS